MKKYITIAILVLLCTDVKSQQFITQAEIEYEVKTNFKKSIGNSSWAEMMKDNLPTYKIAYYTYTFSNNKSIYKFTRWDESASKMPDFLKKSDEDNIWYFDHAESKFSMQKNIFGSNFNIQDSLTKIKWKLSNENRVIAGYNCRKAIGVMMDSVYVFAFYTEEIMIPGGPCSINGLPGMILGLTIPRLYSSWIASSIKLKDVNTSVIKPVTAKTTYSLKQFKTTIKERTKDWGNSDDPESKNWMEQFIWATML